MTLTLSMADTLINNSNSQEADYSYDHHPEEDNTPIDLSLLRINSFGNSSDRRRANSSPPQFPSFGSFSSSSTAAATSPVKRPSPEPKEADEPRRKKLFLSPPETNEADEEEMSTRLGYKKVPLPSDRNPTRIRPTPVHNRSLSDTFASNGYTRGGGGVVARETAPSSGNVVSSLPPRPRKPVFRRSVSDLSPAAPSMALLGSSSREANRENSEANKMLYVIKDGVRELDQWCNKLLHYGEAVKQEDDAPKEEDESQEEEEEEEEEKEYKEGVKVDRVGEAFVVEINCPCGRNYRTLFSGRDCYYKLL